MTPIDYPEIPVELDESECEGMTSANCCSHCGNLISSVFQINYPGTEFCENCHALLFTLTDEDLGI